MAARALLYETWKTNPSLFHLLLLCSTVRNSSRRWPSAHRTFVDSLEMSGQIRRSKTSETILSESAPWQGDADQHFWIRQYIKPNIARGIARHPWDDHLDPNSSRIDGPGGRDVAIRRLESPRERTAQSPSRSSALASSEAARLFMGPTWISFSSPRIFGEAAGVARAGLGHHGSGFKKDG